MDRVEPERKANLLETLGASLFSPLWRQSPPCSLVGFRTLCLLFCRVPCHQRYPRRQAAPRPPRSVSTPMNSRSRSLTTPKPLSPLPTWTAVLHSFTTTFQMRTRCPRTGRTSTWSRCRQQISRPPTQTRNGRDRPPASRKQLSSTLTRLRHAPATRSPRR